MESYFFIPGNRLHKLDAVKSMDVTEVIIDMEDAVKESDRLKIMAELNSNELLKQYYIRIPLYSFDGKPDFSTLSKLVEWGFRKLIFPKINSRKDFDALLPYFRDFDMNIILLVETPRFFLEVKEVLFEYQKYFSGIGIGSHDFMAAIGGVHTLKNIEYIRQEILYNARAVGITAIDIASMELKDQNVFEDEIRDGFEKGYDAKFFIHPWQIAVFKDMVLYSQADLNWALLIEKELEKVGNQNEFNPINVNGQIIERPHLNRMKKILNYYNNEGK